MEELSHLLKPTVKVTERDYSYNVWLPLPCKLFSISGNLIRLKFDESALSHSTTEKQDIYSEEKGVVGFKIDLRCIFDHGEKEFDIACFESCLPDADEAKVRLDGAKLLREARSNLVNLQYALPNDEKLNSWFVQVTGLKAMFSTIVYDDNDLYVSVPQFMIDYPSCIEELESFSGALVKLFSFAFYVEETVHALNQSLIKSKSVILQINFELLYDASETRIAVKKEKRKEKEFEQIAEDMWGFSKKGELWYCSVTGECVDKHPFLNK